MKIFDYMEKHGHEQIIAFQSSELQIYMGVKLCKEISCC